jgi:Glycosyl transferase family 2.
MAFLDNGSTDRTLVILKKLKDEGLPISVFQDGTESFNEVGANTWLYRLADQMHRADWVAFLDTDEFILTSGGNLLSETLATREKHERAVSVQLIHYFDTPEDDPLEPIVPIKMRWRMRAPTGVLKMFVRGGLGKRLVIDAGNHGGFLDGRPLHTPPERHFNLAHYPRRSGWQNLQKIAIGWLKILAAGNVAITAGHSSHYRSPFETLRDKPGELVCNAAYLTPGLDRSIAEEAPLLYLGGPLRYTELNDPALKALEVGLRYAERLARQHGKLLDQSAEARHLIEIWSAQRKFLF